MARIPSTKINDFAKAGNTNNGKLYRVAIMKVDPEGAIVSSAQSPFLLNPSSLRETKSANWVGHNVPMQSDPIYQYVSGGPRTLSFEALVTRDSIHFGKNENSFLSNMADAALNVVGDIASTFAGVTLPPIGNLFSTPSEDDGTQLSISDYLAYYRSLLYPSYSAGYSQIHNSPPLVILAWGKSLSDIPNADTISGPSNPVTAYVPTWIVTNIDINITKFLPNMDPIEAKVSFTLKEYTIRPTSSGNFIPTPPPTGNINDSFGLSNISGGLLA